MNTTINLWDLIFGGETLTDIFVALCFLAGIIMLYCFLQKFFYLKQMAQQTTYFMDNIADCIYDKRIESAQDMCKSTSSAESRIVAKGLLRIEKSLSEVSSAVKNQRELEISEIYKNLHRFSLMPKIVFLLGVLGSWVVLAYYFWIAKETALQLPYFYSFAIPACIGTFLAIFGFIFNGVITSLAQSAELSVRNSSIRFLEIISDNQ
ncbi:MAG: hypothetical protein KBA33_00555 [Cloacibacterium sp.]|jgi:biopolymer transport protein ExbB|nr:hypothetical protein [Cloacibacterium sp.]